jgi:hypothetical protein
MLIPLLLIAFFLQVGSHYMPWARLFPNNCLPRPIAYTIGIVGIYIPLSAWLALRADWLTLAIIWGFTAAAGAGVLCAYGIDLILNWRDQAREAQERESLLEQRHDANE